MPEKSSNYNPEYAVVPPDAGGELYLTESGMYRYMLQSSCKKAEPFQQHAYALLKAARERAVDRAQLARKIEQADEAAPPGPPAPIETLEALYSDPRIRVRGSPDALFIGAAELAASIGDRGYRNALKRYVPGIHIDARVSRGRSAPPPYLTEAGAYRYLLQSNRAAAEPFQRAVYALLKAERLRTVDSIQLAMKIEQTKRDYRQN